MKVSFSILPGLLLALLVGAAAGQGGGAAPLKIVVGFPAGGGADLQARIVASRLAQELGQTVIVDNRAGAGGRLAADFVRLAPADGQTLLFANTHMMVMLPLTAQTLRYDPLRDFRALARISNNQAGIAVPAGAAASLPSWLEAARADAKQASYGVPALGSAPAFIGYKLGTASGTTLLPVPYRGSAPLVQDLLGGQIAAGITPIQDLVAYHRSGRLKVLAVNGAHRAPALPEVPTLQELGQAGFESLEWSGLFVRANTAAAQLERLRAGLARALSQSELQAGLRQLGALPVPADAPGLEQQIAADQALWAPVIKASGFRSD